VTTDDLVIQICSSGVTLAFDTNAVYDDGRLFNLCDRIDHYNVRHDAAALPRVRLVISAVAYTEKLFDLKQRFRDRFDLNRILQGLKRKQIDFHAFDAGHALATAVRLGEKYKDDAEWQRAKRARYIAALGLPRDTNAPATGRNCGATIDWLIGGHAQAEGAILVTDDNDPEFGGGIERVKLEVLEAALDDLLAESV